MKTPDEKREYMRLYMAARRQDPIQTEKNRAASRKWREANREKSAACSKAWRDNNPDRVKAHNVAWRAAHTPEERSAYAADAYRRHRRAHHINKKFGLSTEQYDAMLATQNGCCALCPRSDFPEKRLAVDHDHKTGKIRALLCDRCNRGIGLLDEDITRLQAAIDYIKHHRS
jgi:Recombination endonuclease VII